MVYAQLSVSVVEVHDCHIYFDISTKYRIVEESENGDQRIYSDPKNRFSLVVTKFPSVESKKMLTDSIKLWISEFENLAHQKTKKDTLLIDNTQLVSFTGNFENREYSTYVFSTDTHLYKMQFSYSHIMPDRGRKEMANIINTLRIECD